MALALARLSRFRHQMRINSLTTKGSVDPRAVDPASLVAERKRQTQVTVPVVAKRYPQASRHLTIHLGNKTDCLSLFPVGTRDVS